MVRVIRLVRPDPTGRSAWSSCLEDLAEGPKDGSGYMLGDVVDASESGFSQYLEQRLGEEDVSRRLPPGRVHCSYRWIVDGAPESGELATGVLGFVAVRHALTPFLFDVAGHIGYCVRPSRRREGIAGQALLAALALADELSVSPVLVTCHDDNSASRATIERAGGEFDDVRRGHRRYWFGASPRPSKSLDV